MHSYNIVHFVFNLQYESKFNIQTYQWNTNYIFDHVASKINLNLVNSVMLTSNAVYTHLISSNLELDISLCILFYKFISKTEVYKASKFNN